MQITIKPHQTQLTQEETLQMEKRIHFALGRFGNAINRINVRLIDINGPKGWPDKQCLIVVKLREGGEIVIQGKARDNSSALNYCADRISRAVDPELTRRRRAPIRKIRRDQCAKKDVAFDLDRP